MRTVATKVDVFSFGIVVMEFLTKRRPTGLDAENGLSPISLRQLVEKAVANGINGVRQITDPRLVLCIYEEQEQYQVLEELFKLALACTSSNPEDRPNMNEVLSTLPKLRETRFGNRDEHFPSGGESNTTAPLKGQF